MERDTSPPRSKKIYYAQGGHPGDRSYLAEFLLQQLESLAPDSKLIDNFNPFFKDLIRPHLEAIERIKLASRSDNPNYDHELAAQIFAIFVHDYNDPSQTRRSNYRDLSGAIFVLKPSISTNWKEPLEVEVCGFNLSAKNSYWNTAIGEPRIKRARRFMELVQNLLVIELGNPHLNSAIWDLIDFDQSAFLTKEQMKSLLQLTGKTYIIGHKFATYQIKLPDGRYCHLSPTSMIVRTSNYSRDQNHDFAVWSVRPSFMLDLSGTIRSVDHLYQPAFDFLSSSFNK